MSIIKKTDYVKLIFATIMAAFATCVVGFAQTPAPTAQPKPSPQPKKVTVHASTAQATTSVVVESKSAAPQVVTILHRLNGLQVLEKLMKSGQDIAVIADLDRKFELGSEVHTNIIAGVALDDGRIIAAWLPEAEAELPGQGAWYSLPKTPRAAPPAPQPGQTMPPQPPMSVFPEMPSLLFPQGMLQSSDLKVITSDGKRISGRYIGIDGLTGLSLIALTTGNVAQADAQKEQTIVVGQKLRVIGPQRVPSAETNSNSPVYIRIGETDATVVNVIRSPSGGLARVRIRAAKFSPANIGAIAVNEKNETLGIVDAVRGGEATIVPLSLVRMAAKRVVARQASVPRPWLGISGQPINSTTLERIMQSGWEAEKARALFAKQQGIMLTAVAPGSPAALAKLKAGDVILRVNDWYIRNAQEFSFQLDEVTPENPVRFTIARPEKEAAEAMEIKLCESPDPFFPRRVVRTPRSPRPARSYSLSADGIETVALRPNVASRFGSSNGGLLVVSIEPSTDAFKAGLRPGDLIEMIDGQPVYVGNQISVSPKPGVLTTCVVLRNKEKITMTFKYSLETEEKIEEKIEKRIEKRAKQKENDEDNP